MNILFDSGSLINLAHGQLLVTLATTQTYKGYVGPIVRGECRTIAAQVDQLASTKKLTILPDLAMSAASFGLLLDRFNLGLGETECIAFGTQEKYVISCDDAAARRVIVRELGAKRLTGTIGILVMGVLEHVVSLEDAFASYQLMRSLGGFLPSLSLPEFKSLVRRGEEAS